MGADKRYAIHHDFRIPENFLLGLAFMGGGLGGIVGMHYFRHKTRKLKFRLGFPVCLILNVLMICLILYYF